MMSQVKYQAKGMSNHGVISRTLSSKPFHDTNGFTFSFRVGLSQIMCSVALYYTSFALISSIKLRDEYCVYDGRTFF